MSATMTLAVLLALRDQLSPGLRQVQSNLERTRQAARSLQIAGASMMAGGMMLGRTLKTPISAFADLEEATLALKSAMMRSDNTIAPEFERIQALAVELGNKLPGTTADFAEMFTALIQNGTKAEDILGGLGKTTAYLGIAMKLPATEAANLVATLARDLSIAPKNMMAFADAIQRTRNLGVTATEMGYAFSHSAGALKTVGATGLDAANKLIPMYTMLIRTMKSGERVGTNVASMIEGLKRFEFAPSKGDHEAKQVLAQHGIKWSFFDGKGNLVDPQTLIGQFEQLKKLTTEEQYKVTRGIFGGGFDQQMMQILTHEGLQGLHEVTQQMQEQADLNARIALQLTGLKLLWEAATGTFTNTLAAWSDANSESLKKLATGFNELSEKLSGWIKEYPQIAKWSGAILGVSAAVAVLGGALAIAAGTATLFLAPLAALVGPLSLMVAAGAALVAFNWGAVVAWIDPAIVKARELWDAFKAGIPGAITKARELWDGLKVWSAPAIARAGELWESFKAGIPGAIAKVQDLWDRFKAGIPDAMAKARKLWETFKDGAAQAATAAAGLGRGLASVAQQAGRFGKGFFSEFFAEMSKSKEAGEVLAWLGEKLSALKVAFGWAGDKIAQFGRWLSQLTGPTKAAGDAAEAMGRSWGRATAEILQKILELPGEIKKLAWAMWEAGAALMEGLKAGILAKFKNIKDTIVGLGQSIKGWFSGKDGIDAHSPSRLFMRLGGFLTQGLALGIRQGTPAVLGELGTLAKAVGKGFAPSPLRLVASNRHPLPNLSSAAAPALRLAGRGGGSTVHFNPTINVTGASPGPIKEAVNAALKLSMREFERVAIAVDHAAARRGYA